MIERINFLEKEPFRFSYTKILRVGFVFMTFFAILFGVKYLQLSYHKKKMDNHHKVVESLKIKRNELIKVTPKKISGGPRSVLKGIFTASPEWSSLIKDVGERLPGSVWLDTLRADASFNTAKKAAVKKGDKNDKSAEDKSPAAKVLKRDLTLQGRAKNGNELADFIESLKKSPYLSRANLTSAKNENNTFTFIVDCLIAQEAQE